MEVIEAFDAIEDDAACASEVTKALDDWPDFHARLREIRQRRVNALKAQGKTWEEVGQLIGGVSGSRAQQIGAGMRGAKRPKKSEQSGMAAPPPDSAGA